MSLHAKRGEMKEYQRDQSGEAGTGQMVVKKGYGNECSLMIATRRPGYHTKPHQHESEQINYVRTARFGSSSRTKAIFASKAISIASRPTQCTGRSIARTKTPRSPKPTLRA